MKQYKFEYLNPDISKQIIHTKGYDEEFLYNVLDELSIFINSVGYGIHGLLDCQSEEEYFYLADKQAEYRRNNGNN